MASKERTKNRQETDQFSLNMNIKELVCSAWLLLLFDGLLGLLFVPEEGGSKFLRNAVISKKTVCS
jgi:hypothetical protein